MSLVDQLGRVGLTPADLVALGAMCSAASAAGILARKSLQFTQMAMTEAAERTPQDRLDEIKLLLAGLGPEAQAKAIEILIPSVTELIGISG